MYLSIREYNAIIECSSFQDLYIDTVCVAHNDCLQPAFSLSIL